MSQNLSFSSIAATLAVLSASGLVACAGNTTPPAESPADAKEVPAATTSSATAGVDPGPMKEGVAPLEGASGSTPAPATATEAPKNAAEAATPPASAAPAAAPGKDEKPKAAGKKKAAGAKAGCGAGTCGY
jgi:hypothetical protein